MFRIYSIPIENDYSVINAQADILDDLLPFRILWKFRSDITENDNRSNNMLDSLKLGDSTQWDNAKY